VDNYLNNGENHYVSYIYPKCQMCPQNNGGYMAVKKVENGWRADWRENGKRKRRIFPNKTQADYHLAQRKLFDNSGGESRKALYYKQKTFSDLATEYMDKHLSKTRAKGNCSYIKKLIKKWGDCKLHRIAKSEVKLWIAELINDKVYAISTIKKLLVYFKRVFNWGKEFDFINTNPIETLSFKSEFKRVNKRNVILETEEFWNLIDKFPGSPTYLRLVTIATWCTGMRVGEIINLKWKNVDMVNGLIRLSAEDTKESSVKTIGVEPELMEIFKQLESNKPCNPESYVIQSSKGRCVNHHTLDRLFRKNCDLIGHPDLRLHDIRHSYVTRKRREGFDRTIIKSQVGHSSDSMFDWYNNVNDEEKKMMAGHSTSNLDSVNKIVVEVVKESMNQNIPLGVIQNLIGHEWKVQSGMK